MRSANRPSVAAILFGTVLVLDLATSAAAAGPRRKAPRKERPQEAVEVRTWVPRGDGGPGGSALPAWVGTETQLANPDTQTTCSMRVRRGRIDADVQALPLPSGIDPGIVRFISPCVPEPRPLGVQ